MIRALLLTALAALAVTFVVAWRSVDEFSPTDRGPGVRTLKYCVYARGRDPYFCGWMGRWCEERQQLSPHRPPAVVDVWRSPTCRWSWL